MTISDPTTIRPDEHETRHDAPEGKETLPQPRATRSRKLTAVVLVWILVVVSAAAFLFYRARSASVTNAAATSITSRLYVNPYSQAAIWAKKHPVSPATKPIEQQIAKQPAARWFGAWDGKITPAVDEYTKAAAGEHKIPVLIAYNLPGRDCGGESAGGAPNAAAYNKWIDGFAAGLHNRRALVVLEPDSLAMIDGCLNPAGQQARLDMLSRAVDKLQSQNVWVYLDAGHSNWAPAGEMARRLKDAGIAKAHGFALNVSNYNPTNSEAAYGQQIDKVLGTDKPFIVDTSRNGNGALGDKWCNPVGRKVGSEPQAGTDGAEMLLWLKAPGESDGNCGTGKGTEAGQFSPKLASRLLTGQ